MDSRIMTYSGELINPLEPEAKHIHIQDIAHALSQLCRYTGHTKEFYSVAQHSVLVAQHVPPSLALQGLLHDASEAYLVDVPSPIKPFFPNYAEWEATLEDTIARRFGISYPWDPIIKQVDRELLAHEAARLFKKNNYFPPSPLGTRFLIDKTWGPAEAKQQFLSVFWLFGGSMHGCS